MTSWRTCRQWFVAVAAASSLVACTTGATTGAFAPVQRIEQELHRGSSTKVDVQRVLGTPKGYGATVFPTDRRNLEVWYYEDIALGDMKRAGPGRIQANVRQQILLVTFDNGVLDGFVWFTNAGSVTPKDR